MIFMRRINNRSTKEYALKYLTTCSLLEVKNMQYLKPELKDDPEIVKTVVKKYGWALLYASERLKDDPEIVKIAVKNNGWALEYASARLQDDPEIVITALKQNNEALEYASKRLQALGIDGIYKLAKEQKQKRQIQRSRIDIKNKRLID